MEFGIGIHSGVIGRFPFEEITRIVRLCEDEGLDYVAIPDFKYSRDYIAMLTYIALNSETVKVGPMVTEPFGRHPALTAVAIATIDEISGGRAFLGLGAGEGRKLDIMGINHERPTLAMKEAVEVIRAFWSGKTVDYAGETVEVRNGQLTAKAREDIAIFIWSHSPRMLQTAGEVADCAVIHVTTEEGLKWGMDQVRIGAERAGRDPAEVEIGAYVYSNIDEDSERAKRILRASAAHHTDARVGQLDKATVEKFRSWDYLKQRAIAGTSEECVREFKRLAGIGVKRAMIRPCTEETVEGFERFVKALGREVIPQVK